MNDIMTVTGKIAVHTVTGPVLAHEHLAIDLRTEGDSAGFLDHQAQIERELLELKKSGNLGLIVEQTCRGMGRQLATLRELSETTGVPIVAATGWYYGRFHPDGEPGTSVEDAYEILEREILHGIEGTQIQAGVIGEIGTSGENPTPAEEISLRACARAAQIHQKPLGTHAHLSTGWRAQLDIFESEGLDLSQVVVGHQDLTDDTDQHLEIIARGAYVGFDTVGKQSYFPDSKRAEALLRLLENGQEERIVLSNDISRHGYLKSEGGQGYGHVLSSFAEHLRSEGISEETLDLIYRRNALRWLSCEER